MITLWIAAAFLAAAAAALVAWRAAGASVAGGDGAAAVYRRQLAEIDELAARGLIGAEEAGAAHAETGRRLLDAARAPAPAAERRLSERWVMAAAAAPALAALALYVAVGSPGLPDQPFAARLKAWSEHPERYGPEEMIAALEWGAARNPADPRPLQFLTRLYLNAGDGDDAARVLRRLAALTPNDPLVWTTLGQLAVVKAGDVETAEARADFERALALDANAATARFHIGRGKIAAGDVTGGLADWRVVLAALDTNDPLHAELQAGIATVQASGHLPPPAAPAAAPQITPAIRQMVDGLAARLKAEPNDPQGWVRLVRAYSVMGETGKRDAALAEARERFKAQPQVLSDLKVAAEPPGQVAP